MKKVFAVIASSMVLAMPVASLAGNPEFAADIPDNVLTPDVVNTQTLGKLEFFDGMPSEETVNKAFENLDLIRATTAFLDGMKIASLRGMFQGYEDAGAKPNEIVITETLMDARSIWLT
ncbi:MAG: hypothetical protein OEU78_07155, partial [Gammaproteobacteria bacterium]|nr:hypothetical protein [Gammaproteobacteria bacterium]